MLAQLNAIKSSRAYVEFTPDGKIVGANLAFGRLLKYSVSELKNSNYNIFFDATEQKSKAYCLLWLMLRQGKHHEGQYRWVDKCGHDTWIRANSYPICDASGSPYKIIQFVTDITVEKLAAADIEGQIAAINKSKAIVEFTLDGRIITANKNFLKTFGYTLDEILCEHHGMFVDPADRNTAEYQLFWEKLAKGEYQVGQYRRLGKHGQEVWIHASYSPILDTKGAPWKVVKYAADITAQKLGEIQLKLAVKEAVSAAEADDLSGRIPIEGKTGDVEKLCVGVNGLLDKVDEQTKHLVAQKETAEKAVKVKSEFLSNMSHELRTPMHAILSYAKLGYTSGDDAPRAELEDYFKLIHASGMRLLGLLNDLLDLAKLESGRMILRKAPCDFLEVIEHTRNELKPLLNDKKITLTTDVFADNTKSVFDRQRIIQVLVNLISNSIKYSSRGGDIRVTLSEGRLTGGSQVLCCSVGDEGPGIPEGELETVFDKFIQSSKTKSGAGGTGLGLSICREILKAHDGRIWAENRKPKGALFSFVIPRTLKATSA